MSSAVAADTALSHEELVQGLDARGLQAYGLPQVASDALVHFGSCTANPITPSMLARHRRLSAADHLLDPETHLQLLFGAAQCRLVPSGTDAEYTVALAMGLQPFCNLLMDPAEIGSGCTRAAAGLPHASGCPVQTPLPLQARVVWAQLRDAAGQALAPALVDQQVLDIAGGGPQWPILLHHVPCSKTGLAAPSEAACLGLQHSHPAGVSVVVDASQGRCSRNDVRRWLGHGWAVILTGSKFFGAPPFCGAVLLPANWPKAQGFAVGPGLCARWRLAFDQLSSEPSPEAWRLALHEAFMPGLPEARIDTDLNEGGSIDRQGILSFDVGLDASQTRALHRKLIQRGYFLGQPVQAGSRHLLRLAPAAHTGLASAATQLGCLAQVLRQELRHG